VLVTDPYLHTNGSLSEGCSLPPHLEDDTDAPSLVQTCLIFFGGHLACFCVLTTVDSAAMNLVCVRAELLQ